MKRRRKYKVEGEEESKDDGFDLEIEMTKQ